MFFFSSIRRHTRYWRDWSSDVCSSDLATDVVTERGEEGAARIKELTGGLGAHSVVEAVGTPESVMQAIRSPRPGGHVGVVGVLPDVEVPGGEVLVGRASWWGRGEILGGGGSLK